MSLFRRRRDLDTPEVGATVLTDAQLLQVYLSGVGTGSSSLASNLGGDDETSCRVAAHYISLVLADPAVQETVLARVKDVLAGREPQGPVTIRTIVGGQS